MASLQEIRQQFPQYGDISDADLADKLYGKFYSDMPRDEFNAKIGFTPAPGFGANPAKAFDPKTIQPAEQPVGAKLSQDMEADQIAGSQRTSPVVRNFSGGFTRDPLGEMQEFDFGQAYYDKSGNLTAINPETDVVLRDPQSGKMLVFARTPETDEGAVMGAYRIMAPGMATGPVAGATGKGIAAGVKAATKAPTRAQEVVKAFDNSGIDVSVPVVTQNRGVGVATKTIGDTVAGGPIVRGTRSQIEQAAKRADDIAGGLSDVGDRATAGQRLQQGTKQFYDETIPGIKDQLYGEVRALIPETATTKLPKTLRAVQNVDMKVKSAAVRNFVTDPNYKTLSDTIRKADEAGGLTFDDLRELRTQVRRLKPSQDSKVGLNKRAIDDLYDGLTADMQAMAKREGGQAALDLVKRADRFTAAMAEREGMLSNILKAPAGEKVYDEVLRLASEGAGADWKKLMEVRRAAGANGWNDISATVIRKLGALKPGAVTSADDVEFSVNSFVTNWSKLSENGKNMLFGAKTETRKALEDLVTAVGELKRVEGLANPSGSGRYGTAIATGAGLVAAPITTLSAIGASNVAARVLMSPKAARWVAGAVKLQTQAAKNPSKGIASLWKQHVSRIPAIAAKDKEMAMYLRQLAGEGQAEPGQEPGQPTP